MNKYINRYMNKFINKFLEISTQIFQIEADSQLYRTANYLK